MPDEPETFNEHPRYDEQGNEYQDDQTYTQNEKFEEAEETDEQFNEADEQYQDSVFKEAERREEEQLEFHPEQPKLTPKQRWHRAYNKIVMQLNVSTLFYMTMETEIMYLVLKKCFLL